MTRENPDFILTELVSHFATVVGVETEIVLLFFCSLLKD